MLKTVTKFTIVLSLLLSSLFLLNTNEANAISYKPGDIFITKSTSSKGLTGHSGIVIDSKTILHTSGAKSSPYPKTLSIKDWNKRYPKTKVVRPNSAALGKKAAANAKKYFQNKKIKYKISNNPRNIKYTYCSEIVWYSYYKAGKTYKFPVKLMDGSIFWGVPDIIKPYDYLDTKQLKYNGFKFIDSKW